MNKFIVNKLMNKLYPNSFSILNLMLLGIQATWYEVMLIFT